MIALEDFVSLVRQTILRFEDSPPNQNQEACIVHSTETPLMIVAGPGSEKTTVLVLRALRLVFVDGFRPEEILITTFTRKAVAEIRARLIGWGSSIIHYLKEPSSYPIVDPRNELDSIDLNQFITGTLDSICNDILTTIRSQVDPVPVVVEGSLITRFSSSMDCSQQEPTTTRPGKKVEHSWMNTTLSAIKGSVP